MRHRTLIASGGQAWSPASLGSKLKVWLDADDVATFTYSTDSIVSQWADKSGNSNNGTQGVSFNQPTRIEAQINGKAAVRFVNDDYLIFPNFGEAFTAVEVFAVVVLDYDPTRNTGLSGLWYFSADTQISHIPWTDGNVYDTFGTTVRKNTGDPSLPLTSWRLYNVRSAPGSWSSHIDGTQHYSTATNTVGMGGYWLGRSAGAGFYMEGYFAELIISDSVLSASERSNVHSYIADKYALTITTGTP